MPFADIPLRNPGTVFNITLTAGQVYERHVVDSVLIPDEKYREEVHLQRDQVLLSDQALLQTIRQLVVTDAVLVHDARFSSLDRLLIDHVLVRDVLVRVLDAVRTDQVLVTDSVLVEVFTGVIERLVSLRLRTQDLLGITLTAVDWSGARLDAASLVEAAVAGLTFLRVDARDPLGVTVTYRPSEVRH